MKNLRNIALAGVLCVLAACGKQEAEPFTLSGISTLEGDVDEEITLTGTGLSSAAVVKFGDIEATEKSGGGKTLKVKVPNGSLKGKVSVSQEGLSFSTDAVFTTKTYVQRIQNPYTGQPFNYVIPLLYEGNQVWFKRNLAKDGGTYVGEGNGGIPLFKEDVYVNWSDALIACPQGWRLPSREEYEALAKTSVLTAQQSYELLTGSYFDLSLSGYLSYGVVSLVNSGVEGYFWTSSETSAVNASLLIVRQNTQPRFSISSFNKTNSAMFCVRCVKDLAETSNPNE